MGPNIHTRSKLISYLGNNYLSSQANEANVTKIEGGMQREGKREEERAE